ncbi:hypothetical protein CLOM_g3345 [Closterium sp. NIES-68]|nr:hypothetical protein CLOM_g3345 [Closterium sp. NIES-68]GJP81634.1 hypothetical protein CLOP_g11789 [Closterium sp. NIES-67]
MRSPGSTADCAEDRRHSDAAGAADASGPEAMDQSGVNRDAAYRNDESEDIPSLRRAAATASPTNENEGESSKEKDGTSAKRPRRKQPFPYKHLLPRDGYNWVKYGQKQLSGGLHMRHYFHCMLRNTDVRCPAKRIVNMSKSDCKAPLNIEYINDHNHRPNLRAPSNSPGSRQQGGSLSAEILLQPGSSEAQFTLGCSSSDGNRRGEAMGSVKMESYDADASLQNGVVGGGSDGDFDALRMLTAGDGNDYSALRQTLDEAIRKAGNRVHQQRSSGGSSSHVSGLQVSKLLQNLGRQEIGGQLSSMVGGSSNRGGGDGNAVSSIAGGNGNTALGSLWQRRVAGGQAGAAAAAAAAVAASLGLGSAGHNPPTSLMADPAAFSSPSGPGSDSQIAFAGQLLSLPIQVSDALAGSGIGGISGGGLGADAMMGLGGAGGGGGVGGGGGGGGREGGGQREVGAGPPQKGSLAKASGSFDFSMQEELLHSFQYETPPSSVLPRWTPSDQPVCTSPFFSSSPTSLSPSGVTPYSSPHFTPPRPLSPIPSPKSPYLSPLPGSPTAANANLSIFSSHAATLAALSTLHCQATTSHSPSFASPPASSQDFPLSPTAFPSPPASAHDFPISRPGLPRSVTEGTSSPSPPLMHSAPPPPSLAEAIAMLQMASLSPNHTSPSSTRAASPRPSGGLVTLPHSGFVTPPHSGFVTPPQSGFVTPPHSGFVTPNNPGFAQPNNPQALAGGLGMDEGMARKLGNALNTLFTRNLTSSSHTSHLTSSPPPISPRSAHSHSSASASASPSLFSPRFASSAVAAGGDFMISAGAGQGVDTGGYGALAQAFLNDDFAQQWQQQQQQGEQQGQGQGQGLGLEQGQGQGQGQQIGMQELIAQAQQQLKQEQMEERNAGGGERGEGEGEGAEAEEPQEQRHGLQPWQSLIPDDWGLMQEQLEELAGQQQQEGDGGNQGEEAGVELPWSTLESFTHDHMQLVTDLDLSAHQFNSQHLNFQSNPRDPHPSNPHQDHHTESGFQRESKSSLLAQDILLAQAQLISQAHNQTQHQTQNQAKSDIFVAGEALGRGDGVFPPRSEASPSPVSGLPARHISKSRSASAAVVLVADEDTSNIFVGGTRDMTHGQTAFPTSRTAPESAPSANTASPGRNQLRSSSQHLVLSPDQQLGVGVDLFAAVAAASGSASHAAAAAASADGFAEYGFGTPSARAQKVLDDSRSNNLVLGVAAAAAGDAAAAAAAAAGDAAAEDAGMAGFTWAKLPPGSDPMQHMVICEDSLGGIQVAMRPRSPSDM